MEICDRKLVHKFDGSEMRTCCSQRETLKDYFYYYHFIKYYYTQNEIGKPCC